MLSRIVFVLAATTVVFGNPARIIGGSPAAPGEIPFQLSLQDKDGQHFCGGIIISANTALTAASCIDGLNLGDGRIIAGAVDIASPGSIHRSRDIVIHPDFQVVNGIPTNDIAVIMVDPSFPADSVTGHVFMPISGYETPEGLECTVSGWGTTSFGGAMSNELLKTMVPIISKTECATLYSDLTELPVNQICAGLAEGGADACDRDVGGPLFENGVAYGIYSWGGRCGEPERPGVYTEIAAYRDWIDANTV